MECFLSLNIFVKSKVEIMIETLDTWLPVLMGGLIGYGTNCVAIKMLFRPRSPKYVFGHKLPFTPGMIPKNKTRLAEGIANMVSNKLISVDVLRTTLLSDDMKSRVRQKVHGFLVARQADSRPLSDVLSSIFGADAVNTAKSATLKAIDGKVSEKMTDPELAQLISGKIMEAVQKEVSSNFFLKIGAAIFAGPLESKVSSMVGTMLREQGVSMVSQMIHTEADKLLSQPLCQLLEGRDELFSRIEDGVVDAYQRIVETKLPEMLQAIDIAGIVKQKVVDMDLKELERMILDICDRELKALEWFGAILGALVGILQVGWISLH